MTRSASVSPVPTAQQGRGSSVVDARGIVVRRCTSFLGHTHPGAYADRGADHWAGRIDTGELREKVPGDGVRTQEFAQSSVREVYPRMLGRGPDAGARCWNERIHPGMAVEWVEQDVLAPDELATEHEASSYASRLLDPAIQAEPAPARIGGLARRLVPFASVPLHD